MRILAISGSLRRGSYNTMLVRAAEELLPDGVSMELYTELEALPAYNEDRDTDEAPLAAARLREAIADADAVLFATPEYNGSIPGHLKTAVDWASRPHRSAALWGKPVAGARVAEAEVAVGRAESRFDVQGRLVDEELRDELREAVAALAAETEALLTAA